MKQLKTILFSLPFVLAAVGCSQDELLPDGGKGTDVPEGMQEVEITFDMGTSTALQTRSISRPVVSSDNWQRVNNVRIYLFKYEAGKPCACTAESGCGCKKPGATDYDCNCKYVLTKIENKDGTLSDYLYVPAFEKPEDWGTKPSVVGDCDGTHPEDTPVWGDDEKDIEQHTFTTKIVLSSGARYKFLAVGRDDIDEDWKPSRPNTLQPGTAYKDKNWVYGGTVLQSIEMIQIGDLFKAKELFSGLTNTVIHVMPDNNAYTASIEMKRVVSGMLLYLVNVPAYREARVSFTGYNDYEMEETYIEKGKKYNVTRVAIAPSVVSKTLPLVRLINQRGSLEDYSEPNDNFDDYLAYFDFDGWAIDDDGYYQSGRTSNPHRKDNSILSGGFLPPINLKAGLSAKIGDEEIDENKSLYIVFIAKGEFINTMYPIDWIPVKIKSATDSEGNSMPTEATYYYNFYPNHFYSVGKRNYGRGEDDPIDLKEYFEKPDGQGAITIEIDPDWDEYYGGVLGGEPSGDLDLDGAWGDHPAGEIKKKQ